MVNRRGETKKLRKGDQITFITISDFTGKEVTVEGTVMGNGKAVRKMWPEEAGGAPDECYLVRVSNNFGDTFYHMVFPDQIKRRTNAEENE